MIIARFLTVPFAALLLASVASAQQPRPETRETPRPASDVTLGLYDVRDLLVKTGSGPQEAGPRAPETADPLVRALKAFMPPPLDDGSLSLMNGTIIAKLTEIQHAWLEAFLRTNRTESPEVFRVETQFVVASVPQAVELGIENGLPVYVSNDEALVLVRELIAGMKGAFVGPLESTEVVSGRQGREEMFGEVTYIKAYEKHESVEPGNRTLVVPVIATEREGSFLDVLAVALPGDRIGCILAATMARIEKPVPSRSTPDGPIAVPVVTTISIEAKATFDGKMTIVFPGPARDGRQPFVLTKVSPKASKPESTGHGK